MNSRFFGRVVASFACVALATVSGAWAQPAPYNIDVILPLTGPAAFVGRTDAQMFSTFEKYFNATSSLRGQPVHFEVKDDQSSPQVAVQLANDVVAKRPPVFFGSGVIATCAAIATLVTKGPVQYCLSPGISPPKGSYTFATASSIGSINAGMMNYMRLSGARRIAILGETEATGLETARSIKNVLQLPENRNIRLVSEQHFNPGDLAVNAQAANIKAADAQFVVVSGSGPAFAAALHGLYDAGVNVPVLTTANNMVRDQLKQYTGFFPKELLFNGFPYQAVDSLKSPTIRDRVTAFTSAFKQAGIVPGGLHVLTWDAPLIVMSGLQHLGPNTTADKLKAYLESLHDFVGINGVYDFRSGDQHGLGADAVVVVKWDPQKEDVVPVSDLGGRPLNR
jgi:branched-chain amino acid transport system substrate-binding protein